MKSHSFSHSAPETPNAATADKCCHGFGLPLQGSNLDSSHPENASSRELTHEAGADDGFRPRSVSEGGDSTPIAPDYFPHSGAKSHDSSHRCLPDYRTPRAGGVL